jgi:hypothetical protein
LAKDIADEIRVKAEGDLETFIKLVHPQRMLGSVHKELINWITKDNKRNHKMVLLPRDHMKSAIAAYWVAWQITRNPTTRVLYISSTANLAEKQLGFIKGILTHPIYRRYWPEMVHPDEGKREKWTNSEISVDHPKRKAEAVRDPTVFTGGLTTSLTGLHCDIAVLDDVVVQENAYTEEGRDKTKTQYSLLASIEGADAFELVVGTRYHPKDLYNDLLTTQVEVYDSNGELEYEEALYEVFERQVESVGDGSGEYLWPRQQRHDGKWFGFDQKILAQKRAKYLDKTQFRAQYYNDPNDLSTAAISPDLFQYYDRSKIKRDGGKFLVNNQPVNVYAAIDFAYSKRQKADYTAIVVIGVDAKGNHYILEIDRFKTNLIGDYFQRILTLHQKWDFRKLRAEVTAAQEIIVRDLKENYIKPHGLSLIVDEFRPTRHIGNKEERMEATLQPKYTNRQMWHYRGGNCQLLEEELVLQNPPHDDIKDALANAIDIAVAPTAFNKFNVTGQRAFLQGVTNSRFGGISY